MSREATFRCSPDGVGLRRIVVGGVCGSGKTCLATELADRLRLPYVDVDALFHGPGWTVREDFVRDVERFVAGEGWVADSEGYERYVGSRVRDRADAFVWLDYPRWVVMCRVIKRTLRRVITREELFNGNRERLVAAITDPRHTVRLAWSHHAQRRALNERLVARGAWQQATVVRLHTPRETRRWVRLLCSPVRPARRQTRIRASLGAVGSSAAVAGAALAVGLLAIVPQPALTPATRHPSVVRLTHAAVTTSAR